MSGLLTIAEYMTLVPGSTLAPSVLASYLMAAQGITEQLTGFRFGCEVTAVTNTTGNLYRLDVGYPLGDPGDKVRLVGGGVTATPFVIVDASRDWIVVESAVPIAPTKAMQVIEYVGKPASGYVYVSPLPVFAVESVKTRTSPDHLWKSSDVTTLPATSYEVFTKANGIKSGVQVKSSAVPKRADGAPWLMKAYKSTAPDSVKVEYAAGYYAAVPPDLRMAQVELVAAIEKSVSGGGVFASESYDYYSYTTMTYEQTAAVPSSALATFRRYARF